MLLIVLLAVPIVGLAFIPVAIAVSFRSKPSIALASWTVLGVAAYGTGKLTAALYVGSLPGVAATIWLLSLLGSLYVTFLLRSFVAIVDEERPWATVAAHFIALLLFVPLVLTA